MKKMLVLIIGCMILGACVTLTPEQKRELFEQKIPKPVFECGNIGKMPTKVSVSEEEIGIYDYEGCDFRSNGMRPIQQINSREFLAYLCGSLGCSATYIFHVKFPYPVQQLGVNSYYKFPEDICRSSKENPPYSYTTQSGLKNTVYSVNLMKVKLASKTKRQQQMERLKTKKLKDLQGEWLKKHEEQERCLSISSGILKAWEVSNDAGTFCRQIGGLIPFYADRDVFDNYWRRYCLQYNQYRKRFPY